jgi:succinyl-diaminopimelate desuccinylase
MTTTKSELKDLSSVMLEEIESARGDLINLCANLVSAASVNPPGRTSDVADVVRGYLSSFQVTTTTEKADDEAPNLVADIVGRSGERHVVFNAHMDTMEASDPPTWSVPIFQLTRRDGRLYGLGMGNMKGALAAMCLATTVLNRHRAAWSGRVTMTAVSDEVMFGERGTVHLLRTRPDLAGDFLISGEGPGFMQLAVAEKGLLWLDIQARSAGGHASRALRNQTAVMRLGALLAQLDGLNDTYATLPPELKGVTGGEGNLGLRLSLNAGTINGGTVRSQIATRARTELDIRLPPGISAKECENLVRAQAEPNIDVSVVKAWDANWTALDNPLVVNFTAAVERVRGKRPNYVVRLPGSDARRWRDLGVPALCYGPQPTLSAGADDYVIEQDVVDCAKVYALTALALMQ